MSPPWATLQIRDLLPPSRTSSSLMIFHWSVGSAQMKLAFWGHVGKAELMGSLCCICKEKGGIQGRNPTNKTQQGIHSCREQSLATMPWMKHMWTLQEEQPGEQHFYPQNLVWQPSEAIPAPRGAGQDRHTPTPPTRLSWLSERFPELGCQWGTV